MIKDVKSVHKAEKAPKGYSLLGNLSAIRYSIVPKMKSGMATISASIPRNIYTMSDESGIMGKAQGPFYVMAVSVVSNWDIYGRLAPVDEMGEYIKFNSAMGDVPGTTLANIDSLLNRSYLIAIRKGNDVPKSQTQKRVHAAGILALANQIMKVEHAQRIDSAIDFSTLTEKMPIELLYERNANARGRSVEARVEHARSFGPLAMNDYLVGSYARWMNHGLSVEMEMLNTELYYCITNIEEMDRLGTLAVDAMKNNDEKMPDDDLVWTRLKIPDEKPDRDAISKSSRSIAHRDHCRRKGLGDVTSLSKVVLTPESTSTHTYKKASSSGCEDRPRDSKGRFVKSDGKRSATVRGRNSSKAPKSAKGSKKSKGGRRCSAR